MTKEHNARSYHPSLLDSTFSRAALISAVVAVASGQLADAAHVAFDAPLCVGTSNTTMTPAPCNNASHTVAWAECKQGVPLAPFNLVVICCVTAAAIITLTWTENTGASSSSSPASARQGGQLMMAVNRIIS